MASGATEPNSRLPAHKALVVCGMMPESCITSWLQSNASDLPTSRKVAHSAHADKGIGTNLDGGSHNQTRRNTSAKLGPDSGSSTKPMNQRQESGLRPDVDVIRSVFKLSFVDKSPSEILQHGVTSINSCHLMIIAEPVAQKLSNWYKVIRAVRSAFQTCFIMVVCHDASDSPIERIECYNNGANMFTSCTESMTVATAQVAKEGLDSSLNPLNYMQNCDTNNYFDSPDLLPINRIRVESIGSTPRKLSRDFASSDTFGPECTPGKFSNSKSFQHRSIQHQNNVKTLIPGYQTHSTSATENEAYSSPKPESSMNQAHFHIGGAGNVSNVEIQSDVQRNCNLSDDQKSESMLGEQVSESMLDDEESDNRTGDQECESSLPTGKRIGAQEKPRSSSGEQEIQRVTGDNQRLKVSRYQPSQTSNRDHEPKNTAKHNSHHYDTENKRASNSYSRDSESFHDRRDSSRRESRWNERSRGSMGPYSSSYSRHDTGGRYSDRRERNSGRNSRGGGLSSHRRGRSADSRRTEGRRHQGERNTRTYSCPYCGLRGLSENQLWIHCPLYHINEPNAEKVTCPICQMECRASRRSKPFQVHLRNKHGLCSNGLIESEDSHRPDDLYSFALVVCTRSDGRILLVHEFANSGMWLPGGGVNPLESFQDAALRETKEEAGVDIELTGILKIEHSPHHRYTRMRVIFTAKPKDEAQLCKSLPCYESVGACWVEPEKVARLPLRGRDPLVWIDYLANGGMVYPLAVLGSESH